MQHHKKSAKQAVIENYAALVRRVTPKSKVGQGCLRSFWVGGAICVLGQAIADFGINYLGLTASSASTFASMSLVFITALLTGIGIFDRIARYAGAGTVVPISGFANAMVSPAMEFKPEGWVLGTGARMFTIAGPVLVYGIASSVIVGILYYFIQW
ncbi:MAG: stage V sporulation protein AC [Clostridia bacterium]|nr:stage V sporulation protein AC [Clostridia bacterium]